MVEISVITFKRGINKDILFSVSSRIEHWGIYVDYKEGNPSQMFYHADKTSLTNISTLYKSKPWTWLNNNDNKVDYLVLVGYSSKLTHENMDDICCKISKDRIFNTLTNNCQEWVKNVLFELVNTGNLSRLSLEELKSNNEITPLLGW
jgi:hypothetical protein